MLDPASDAPDDGRRGAKTSRWETERAVLASNLPANARLVLLTLCVIVDYRTMTTPPKYAPSLATLATMTGLGESTVKRVLNQLESAGWVSRTRPSVADARSKGARTLYQVKIPSGPSVGPVTSEGGPAAGPGDGPERAQGGPTAGLNQHLPEQDSENFDDDDFARARDQNHHVENLQSGNTSPAPAPAGIASPDPHPSLPVTGPSAVGPTAGIKGSGEPAAVVGTGADLVQVLIDAVHEVTGQTIDRDLAGKGVAMVLRTKDGTPRAVSDPVAYLRTAVEAAPTRFLPSMVPPRAGGRRESRAARRARGFEELRAWAAEAPDGGQRLDNTGVTVVDQDGQAAKPVPTEPLNDPWTTGTNSSGWMATPVRQRDPEPHVCRYGCRPGPHTYEDPETGVPTRCPIHHEHARRREAA